MLIPGSVGTTMVNTVRIAAPIVTGTLVSAAIGVFSTGYGLLIGSDKVHNVSKHCAAKEQEQTSQCKKMAYKVGKWATLVFGTMLGLAGSIAFGAGVGFGVGGFVMGGTLLALKISTLFTAVSINTLYTTISIATIATVAGAAISGSAVILAEALRVLHRDICQAFSK